jgi:MoaA/NifB/PqqE/SkfB family radical SAM enzyme
MSVDESLTLLEKWRNQSAEQFIPLQASLELTYRCNERCSHCYIDHFWDDPKRILKLEHWYNILHELRGAGTLYIILMGGEAMLNPHFWSIAAKASELGMHVSMITNALKITDIEVAKKLKDAGIKVITVSLYSMDAAIHDTMTKVRGSHTHLLKAIDWCQQAGLQVGANCLLTTHNIAGFYDVADWCIARGIEIKEDVTVTAKFSGDTSPTQLRATSEQIEAYFRERVRRWPKGLPTPSGFAADDYTCNLAKGKCAVTPYGELLGCIEIRQPLGNLAFEPFEKLWYSQTAEQWRQVKNKDLKFSDPSDHDCESFCDHCPGMALHENKDAFTITKDTVRIATIKKRIYEEFRQLPLD